MNTRGMLLLTSRVAYVMKPTLKRANTEQIDDRVLPGSFHGSKPLGCVSLCLAELPGHAGAPPVLVPDRKQNG